MNRDDRSDDLQQLRQEVAELKESVQDLVDAWRTATGVVRFVKWLSGMAIAVASVVALFKTGNGK